MTESGAPSEGRPGGRELLLWGILVAVMLGLVIATLRRDRAAEIPVLWEVPSFELTNRDGRSIGREDLQGHPWVADFIFTRCPAICPRMSEKMADLAGQLRGSMIHFVSFTVDPEYDTPQQLQSYAQRFDAAENWYFLSGEKEVLRSLSRDGFKLGVEDATAADVAANGSIIHSNRLVLVDGQGRVRGFYDAFDGEAMDRLRSDVRRLLRR